MAHITMTDGPNAANGAFSSGWRLVNWRAAMEASAKRDAPLTAPLGKLEAVSASLSATKNI